MTHYPMFDNPKFDGKRKVPDFTNPNYDGVNMPHAKGAAYVAKFDYNRLTGQMLDIWRIMRDGGWYTYREIRQKTGHPENSISAQMRRFRSKEMGRHTVLRRLVGNPYKGLNEYKLILQAQA